MSNLIRKEEVINIIHNKIQSTSDFLQHDVLIDVEFEVDELSTVEVPQWIPCSERLPNESETWYLNIEEGIHEPNEFIVQVKGAEFPTVAVFDGETFKHGYADDGYGFCDEIIAWMPLPQSYKGE